MNCGSGESLTEGRVSVNLHPVISLVLVASTPPASKETRMNNVLRNYN
jgi:DNA polymerase III psi subunit